MSFFRRNKNEPLIPPVAAPEPKADPYASPAAPGGSNKYGGGGAGGGDPYARARPAAGAGGGGGGGGANDNPYAQSGGNDQNNAARNELFAGYAAPEKPKAAREYGYEGREAEEDFDEDEEIEGIKQEMRGIKQDSLASTRNALRLAREAEENARGTVAKLADQSERIANSERYLDMAKANNLRAEDKAEELRKLSRSIFRPVVVWNKEGKRQAEEEKINNRHAMERVDRAKALNDISDTRRRLGSAANPAPGEEYVRQPLPGERKAKQEARSRYQFDAVDGDSDNELEDELDENLDQTYEVTKRLKNLAVAMGDEVAGQNSRLTRVTDKTENLEFAVMKNTDRLKRIR